MKKILPIVLVVLGVIVLPVFALSASATSSFPKYVDNSKTKYFPPIADQGKQGSCVAFSSCYYQLTYTLAKARNLDVKNDSENKIKFSPKWTYNLMNGGENKGVNIGGVLNSLKNVGCLPLCDYPYNPYEDDYKEWSTNVSDWRAALNNRISNWGQEYIGPEEGADTIVTGPDDANIQKIKSRLSNGEVLTFATKNILNLQFIKAKSNPNPEIKNDDSFIGKDIGYFMVENFSGAHQVTIVGYNDDVFVDLNNNGTVENGELGVFIIANSGGTQYGDQGFLYVAYDALNKVSVHPDFPSSITRIPFMSSYYYMEVASSSAPKVIAEVNVTAKTRNTIFEFGVTDDTSTTPPSTFKSYSFVYALYTPISYDGTYKESTSGFAFDITDLLEGGLENKKVWLRVSDTIADFQPTILNDFQVVDLTTGKTAHSLGVNAYADGKITSSVKQIAITSVPLYNLTNNTALKTSAKAYEKTRPFYLANSKNLRLTKVTVSSPNKSLDIPLSSINTQHAYNMFRGEIEFSKYDYEKGYYEIIMNCLDSNNVPVVFKRTIYCNPKIPSTNTNLALNKPVNASVTNWGDETPNKAVNGTWNGLSDKWCSGYGAGNGSWLTVDLGDIVKIKRWLVVHEKGSNSGYDQYFTSNFSLEASYDNINWKAIDTVENNTDGITNRYLRDTIQARYLRLKIKTADIDNVARIYEFQLYYHAPISTSGNIALYKKATASVENWRSGDSIQSPDKAVNGTCNDSNDKWCTGPERGNGSWLTLDLGDVYKINRIKVIHEKGAGFPGYEGLYTRIFKIRVSPDGVNDWSFVDGENNDVDGKRLGITEKSIEDIEARYVQLYIVSSDVDNIARIYEFQLYND